MNELLARRGVPLALILVCGALVFANTPGNSFHYDDEHSILENPHIRSLANVPRFFVDAGTFSGLPEARMYRPLLLTSYALNHALHGYAVEGFHLVNLLLHLANAALVWGLVRRLAGGERAALAAGLFFAVHPLMSEPVNYISSRSSLLATTFLLMAFRAFVNASAGSWKDHARVGLLLLAGLSSKETAFAFPFAAAAYVLLVDRRQSWKLLVGPAVLSALYLVGTRAIVGKALLAPVRSHLEHLATQSKALVFYVWKAFLPVRLSVEPQFRISPHFGEGVVLAALLALFSAALLLGRRGGPRLALFGGVWFFLGLMPATLVPLNVLVNEHRLYLPMAGAALALGALWSALGPAARRLWVPLLAVLALLCWQRNRAWESEQTLWADAVSKGPFMARSHVNLGKALLEEGKYAEAVEASRKALEINSQLERAHYNIGTAYMHQDKLELAVAHLRRALEIHPDEVAALNNLGNTYQEMGRPSAAVEQYRLALAVQEYPSVHHNLGNALLEMGRPDSAALHFRRALVLDAEMKEAYKGLVKACRAEERLQTALEVLEEALGRWPDDTTFLLMAGDAYAALGQGEKALGAYRRAGRSESEVYAQMGREALRRNNWERARQHFEEALRVQGEDARLRNDLGSALYGAGQVARALEEFRRAAQLDPKLGPAYANIGRTYLRHGRSLEAIAALERAAELEQGDGGIQALLAQAYEQAGKGERALRAWQEAVRLQPERAEYLHNLAFLHYGQGHRLEAERLYRAALEKDPRMVQALFNLGVLYLDQRRFAEAAGAYEQAALMAPERADALINLATARINLGQGEKALAAYERALQLPLEAELRTRVESQVQALRRNLGR